MINPAVPESTATNATSYTTRWDTIQESPSEFWGGCS